MLGCPAEEKLVHSGACDPGALSTPSPRALISLLQTMLMGSIDSAPSADACHGFWETALAGRRRQVWPQVHSAERTGNTVHLEEGMVGNELHL